MLNFAAEIKRIEYDSSSKETIGNPYGTIFKFATGESREDKKIVIMFLTESLAESKEDAVEPELTEEEKDRDFRSLCGCWKDDPEDAARMEAAIKDGRSNVFMREINLDD